MNNLNTCHKCKLSLPESFLVPTVAMMSNGQAIRVKLCSICAKNIQEEQNRRQKNG